ncbi:unnamed protein product [Cylicostephanus goldi]|uniref:Uncharacterized protein n=1 Tax=Cylicostephanus goldi TaxID=71465 RepID=A0A3P6R5H0_CYLGO|nr:unnamed protein product [Cylicostephanus goldi]
MDESAEVRFRKHTVEIENDTEADRKLLNEGDRSGLVQHSVKIQTVTPSRDILVEQNTLAPRYQGKICQDCCPTREDKDKHESQTKHKKKLLVYEFFAKEIPKFGPFSGSSVLLKRYTACGERVVGLECVHELHFSFTVQPWWACSICYESGALMEQADVHLTSMSHITTYLDEFHSSKIASLHMDGDRLEVYKEIRRLCDVIIEEQGTFGLFIILHS